MVKNQCDWLLRTLLTGVATTMCSTAIAAASLDTEKLRLLSCDPPQAASTFSAPTAEQEKATAWLNALAVVLPQDGGLLVAGPVKLGKACMKNITISGGFGVMMIQGEICNARLDDFTDTLAAAGTVLEKNTDEEHPEIVVAKKNAKWAYYITRGLVDLSTGKPVPVPKSAPYAFMCSASGGAQ